MANSIFNFESLQSTILHKNKVQLRSFPRKFLKYVEQLLARTIQNLIKKLINLKQVFAHKHLWQFSSNQEAYPNVKEKTNPSK